MLHIDNQGVVGVVFSFRQFILNLGQNDGTTVGYLVLCNDRSDFRDPLRPGIMICLIGGSVISATTIAGPESKATAVRFSIAVRAGSGDDVESCFLGGVKETLNILSGGGKIVGSFRRRMITPEEVD